MTRPVTSLSRPSRASEARVPALAAFAVALSLTACSRSEGVPSAAPDADAAVVRAVPRELDFAPFADALARLAPDRARALDALTREADLPTLAARLAAGDVGARELTLFYVDRIRRLDGRLRSVAELNPAALERAGRLDRLRADGGPIGPLHGVPILLKDNIATGDRMHTTAGAIALAGHRAPRDAFVVAHLREAGAVILGKTNMSEWAHFMSSGAPSGFSALGGQVVNPHGEALDVLGSSTGSAVAAAARFAAATIGTETTGSIIAPAAANGVAGLRPTSGLVSGDLIVPVSAAFDGAGPIGRHVADLAALLDVMDARDERDPNAPLAGAGRDADARTALEEGSLEGLRIGIPSVARVAREDDGAALFLAAIETLERAGATIAPVPVSSASVATLVRGQIDAFVNSMDDDVAAYLAATGASIASLADVIAFNERDPATRAPFGQDLLIRARDGDLSAAETARLVDALRATAMGAIRSGARRAAVDVLLSMDNAFSLYYALAGVPAVTVPMGLDARGQPHGATFVGIERASDGNVLAIAHAFERVARAREEPPLAP